MYRSISLSALVLFSAVLLLTTPALAQDKAKPAPAKASEAKPAPAKASEAKPAEEAKPATPAAEAPAVSKPTPKKQASALYRAGNQQAKEGVRMTFEGGQLLEKALANFKKASELFSSFKIDLNIGGVMAAMGRRAESAAYHEEFLLKVPKTVPAEIVTAAKQKLGELRAQLGSLMVESPLEGMAIQINGDDVAVTPQKKAHYLEPGKYVLILSREGFVTDTRKLVLKKGDHQVIKVQLTSLAEAERQQRAAQELLRKKDRKKIIGYSALAAGAALAVGAAVLYGVGAARGNEAFDGYTSTTSIQDQQKYVEQVDTAEGMVLGGHVLIGVAAVAFGVSAWQLITAASMDEEALPPAEDTSVKAALAPTVGGAAFSLSGRF